MEIRKLLLIILFEVFTTSVFAQHIESVGLFGGFNIPVTFDEGLDRDPRYSPKFEIKGTPIGIHYEYDRAGSDLGLVVTPSFTRVGQRYFILNSEGGTVGYRNIDMKYFSLPISIKYRLLELSFFRLNVVGGFDFCFLIDGSETIDNENARLSFPPGVSVPTTSDYEVVYDGVFVPNIANQVYVDKEKYRLFQLFTSLGIRGDIDLDSDNKWTILLDCRLNYGLFDSRKNSYLNSLKQRSGPVDVFGDPGSTDLYGSRNDSFASVVFGISRVITTGHRFKVRRSPRRKSFKFEAVPEK